MLDVERIEVTVEGETEKRYFTVHPAFKVVTGLEHIGSCGRGQDSPTLTAPDGSLSSGRFYFDGERWHRL